MSTIPKLFGSTDECGWAYMPGEENLDNVLRWKTLVGDGGIEAKEINMGLFEIPPGKQLAVHHHAVEEIYHIVDGVAQVLLDEDLFKAGPGDTISIPADVSHGIKNIGDEWVKLYWMFPSGNWKEIEYHMEDRYL